MNDERLASLQARYLVRLDDACPTSNRKMWREAESILDANDVRPIVAVIPDNRDAKMLIDEPDPDFWERTRGWQARGDWRSSCWPPSSTP
jgi:hypothetical protein